MHIRIFFILLFLPLFSFAQTIAEVEAAIAKELKETEPDTIPLFIPTLKDTIQDLSAIEEFPLGLMSNVDSMLGDWYLNHYVEIDSFCVSEYEPMPLNDSIIRARLKALPTVIPLDYNPIVKKYIEAYVNKRRSLVSNMLGLGHFYFPIFEEVLDREDAPLELKYLPIIESALKPTVRSRMGATGLWQFMYATGKSLGLEINSLVDERCDPYKSTEAAVEYLKQLYSTYKDWNMAIAAYNCGPGNVNKAIRRAGGKRSYWEIYEYLPRETRGYVPSFIAANYVMNYYCEHNMCPSLALVLPATDTIMIKENVHFQQICDNLDLDIEQVRMLNPQYRKDIIPAMNESMPLTLPIKELYAFIKHQDSIINYNAKELISQNGTDIEPGGLITKLGTTIHRVSSGETLGHIAAKHNTTVSTIKKLNGLKSDRLRIGQQLIVYQVQSNSSSTTASSSSSSSRPSGPVVVKEYYTVANGDNLWLIAQKYPGVSADNIKSANNLRSTQLKIGQRLAIPSL